MSAGSGMRLLAAVFLTAVLGFNGPVLASQDAPGQVAEEQLPGEELPGKETVEQGYAGPHGGFSAKSDSYTFEVQLEQSGLVKMWLYDGEAAPVPVIDIPARWTLAPGTTYPLKGNFNTFEDGSYYWVQFPPHESEAIHIKVEAMKDGKWTGVEYYLPVGRAADPAPSQS